MGGQLHALTDLSPGFPCTLWIGNWVGPITSLDLVAKRKVTATAGNQTMVVQPVAYCFAE
jgi:hypothetical protein